MPYRAHKSLSPDKQKQLFFPGDSLMENLGNLQPETAAMVLAVRSCVPSTNRVFQVNQHIPRMQPQNSVLGHFDHKPTSLLFEWWTFPGLLRTYFTPGLPPACTCNRCGITLTCEYTYSLFVPRLWISWSLC